MLRNFVVIMFVLTFLTGRGQSEVDTVPPSMAYNFEISVGDPQLLLASAYFLENYRFFNLFIQGKMKLNNPKWNLRLSYGVLRGKPVSYAHLNLHQQAMLGLERIIWRNDRLLVYGGIDIGYVEERWTVSGSESFPSRSIEIVGIGPVIGIGYSLNRRIAVSSEFGFIGGLHRYPFSPYDDWRKGGFAFHRMPSFSIGYRF